jgi:hypothetical protein
VQISYADIEKSENEEEEIGGAWLFPDRISIVRAVG